MNEIEINIQFNDVKAGYGKFTFRTGSNTVQFRHWFDGEPSESLKQFTLEQLVDLVMINFEDIH